MPFIPRRCKHFNSRMSVSQSQTGVSLSMSSICIKSAQRCHPTAEPGEELSSNVLACQHNVDNALEHIPGDPQPSLLVSTDVGAFTLSATSV